MALAAPPVHDRKRVKVYELKSNDWFDRGTGFCTGTVVNVSDLPFVAVNSLASGQDVEMQPWYCIGPVVVCVYQLRLGAG